MTDFDFKSKHLDFDFLRLIVSKNKELWKSESKSPKTPLRLLKLKKRIVEQTHRSRSKSKGSCSHTPYGAKRQTWPHSIRSRCCASSGSSFALINPNGGGPYRQAHGRHRPSAISSYSKGATNG